MHRTVHSCAVPRDSTQSTRAKRKRSDDDHEVEREHHLRFTRSSSSIDAPNMEAHAKRQRCHVHPALRDVSQVRLYLSPGPEFTVDFAGCNGDSIHFDDVLRIRNATLKECEHTWTHRESQVWSCRSVDSTPNWTLDSSIAPESSKSTVSFPVHDPLSTHDSRHAYS